MRFNRFIIVLLLAFLCSNEVFSQILTKEDSLNAGLIASAQATLLSSYGEVQYVRNNQLSTAEASVRRNILFLGHKFNNRITFFSEMEMENAVVTGEGGSKGELSMEQLFVKFDLNRNNYIVTGLFIPRIGITNENHLPTTYNGVERHMVEQLVIPSTWREIGIGLYSNIRSVPGLNLSCALVNGLSSASFVSGSGLREGRQGGSQATMSNLAVTGAALYYHGNWRTQISAYYGGSAGLTKREADSLQLSYGAFGTPVGLLEANVQYLSNGLSAKLLAVAVNTPDAQAINRAYANNTPEKMLGAFAEIGYNIFNLTEKYKNKNMTVFARYEWIDMDYKIADNGIVNDVLNKKYITAGVTFQPVRGVALKADYTHRFTGTPNPNLYINPFPQSQPYFTSNGFVNLGITYSF